MSVRTTHIGESVHGSLCLCLDVRIPGLSVGNTGETVLIVVTDVLRAYAREVVGVGRTGDERTLGEILALGCALGV